MLASISPTSIIPVEMSVVTNFLLIIFRHEIRLRGCHIHDVCVQGGSAYFHGFIASCILQ